MGKWFNDCLAYSSIETHWMSQWWPLSDFGMPRRQQTPPLHLQYLLSIGENESVRLARGFRSIELFHVLHAVNVGQRRSGNVVALASFGLSYSLCSRSFGRRCRRPSILTCHTRPNVGQSVSRKIRNRLTLSSSSSSPPPLLLLLLILQSYSCFYFGLLSFSVACRRRQSIVLDRSLDGGSIAWLTDAAFLVLVIAHPASKRVCELSPICSDGTS